MPQKAKTVTVFVSLLLIAEAVVSIMWLSRASSPGMGVFIIWDQAFTLGAVGVALYMIFIGSEPSDGRRILLVFSLPIIMTSLGYQFSNTISTMIWDTIDSYRDRGLQKGNAFLIELGEGSYLYPHTSIFRDGTLSSIKFPAGGIPMRLSAFSETEILTEEKVRGIVEDILRKQGETPWSISNIRVQRPYYDSRYQSQLEGALLATIVLASPLERLLFRDNGVQLIRKEGQWLLKNLETGTSDPLILRRTGIPIVYDGKSNELVIKPFGLIIRTTAWNVNDHYLEIRCPNDIPDSESWSFDLNKKKGELVRYPEPGKALICNGMRYHFLFDVAEPNRAIRIRSYEY